MLRLSVISSNLRNVRNASQRPSGQSNNQKLIFQTGEKIVKKTKTNPLNEAAIAIHNCASVVEMLMRTVKEGSHEYCTLAANAMTLRSQGRNLERTKDWPVHSTNGVAEVR